MRTPFVAGNWKMHNTRAQGRALIRDLRQRLKPDWKVRVAVCPPFTLLLPMGAEIEGGFYMPHSLGTIISVKTVGRNFSCYHKVGIGSSMEAGGGDLEENRPVFGDNVQVYTGATIIGAIKIGNNVTIGANAVVITDVPDNCLAVGVPARIIPKKDKVGTGEGDKGKNQG